MFSLSKLVSKEVSAHINQWKSISIDLKKKPPTEPKHNKQCMYNAMNEYKAGRSVAIIEVASQRDGIVHYLSMTENGEIYDPTLGWSYSGVKYKLIRYIHPETDINMGEHLKMAKEKLFNDACSKSTKLLAKITGKSGVDFL